MLARFTGRTRGGSKSQQFEGHSGGHCNRPLRSSRMSRVFLLLCLSGAQLLQPECGSTREQLRVQQPGKERRKPTGALEKLFQQFVTEHDRNYKPGSPRFIQTYRVFQESIQRHYTMNLISSNLSNESDSAVYGINQFSDISPEVFRATYLGSRSVPLPKYMSFLKDSKKPALPAKFNWRDKNVVTPVRNQETCGGCWAFSVVESIESSLAIKRGQLKMLSAQQVIDCSYKDAGCNGGSPISALKWLNESKTKLMEESVYPFIAKTGICHYFPKSAFGVSIRSYRAYSFRYNEEELMQKLLEWGPLVAVVDAVSWQDYLGGIIQHHCSHEEPNHAVVITGYDRTGDIPYWIVRNSWGARWGINGYVYIKMGRNICGIADSIAVGIV
ncbi:cathepsin O isoform X2 [Pristis pectinata]|uniref:cathepsin O isoform X2 n=1 Tax=Pristis pectinata TaxID=685728 RepID=UPI00223D61C2|nr:cathepsin O isoform X2 [Pristis pectinata]